MGVHCRFKVWRRKTQIKSTSTKMKLALIFLFAIFAIGTASPSGVISQRDTSPHNPDSLFKALTKVSIGDCDGTWCHMNCCEGHYLWYCCPGNDWCAVNSDYCP